MEVVLGRLTFDLPEWEDRDFSIFRQTESYFKGVAKTAGTNNDKYQLSKVKLRNLVLGNHLANVTAQINSTTDIRAYFDLLTNDRHFFNNVEFTRADMAKFLDIKNPMSKLTLVNFIRLYVMCFDTLVGSDISLLKEITDFIKEQLKQVATGKANPLSVFNANRELLFDIKAPANLVQQSKSQNKDLDQILQELGLDTYTGARFLSLCRIEYYVQTLEEIPVGSDHEILTELIKPDVYNAFVDEEKMIGHKVIEIMIDRSATISQEWINVILSIAGDPRVPKFSENFRKWWEKIPQDKIRKMTGWLSQLDLGLFLDVLGDSAKNSTNESLKRMFPERKAFLEGLLKAELVVESRLFLSRDARYYLKRSQYSNALPAFAENNSRETSVIYLKLANDVHLIEGSHSFKIKLMDKLPPNCDITNWNVTSFSDNAFRTQIGLQYHNAYGNEHGGYLEKAHQMLSWQHAAINYLKEKSLPVEVSNLLTKTDYIAYRRRFGL